MKKSIFLAVSLMYCVLLSAQYETPGTGINWDLDDLVTNSDGNVTVDLSGQYNILGDIILMANDTLSIVTAAEINVADGVLVTIQGTLICQPADKGVVFFKAAGDYYLGFRFEEGTDSRLANTYFKKAGGIKLIDAYVEFEDCDFTEFNQEYSTGTINLSGSSPLISNCSFTYNDGPALMSGANTESSPQIFDCEIKFNVVSNSNTPQINLGTSGADSIRIVNNEIIGNPENIMAGGIAISTLAGDSIKARIQGNTIRNNRYGITALGFNIGSLIIDNEIADNNTQNLPLMGGSGLNFNGNETNQSIVAGNIITGNLWGITIQGTAQPNFGKLEGETYNVGANQIFDNGNEGEVYDLYNNTPNTIWAQNNYWGTMDADSVEMHIFHQPDDPSLGLIEFQPLYNPPVGIMELGNHDENMISRIFPNPASDHFFMDIHPNYISDKHKLSIEIWDVSGRKLNNVSISRNGNIIGVSLPANISGFVFVNVKLDSHSQTTKVLIR